MNVLPLVLIVVTTSCWIRDPLVRTAAVPPFLVAPLADPLVKSASYEAIKVRLHQRFRSMPSYRPAMSGTVVEIRSPQMVPNYHGGDGKMLML